MGGGAQMRPKGAGWASTWLGCTVSAVAVELSLQGSKVKNMLTLPPVVPVPEAGSEKLAVWVSGALPGSAAVALTEPSIVPSGGAFS